MNTLWQQYMNQLLCLRPSETQNGLDTNDCAMQTNICSKLTKADLSGAKTLVVNAVNKTLIGEEGIIVRETTRTFVIIKPGNEMKVLLKEGAVFQFVLPEGFKDRCGKAVAVNIWGDNILYKGSERTKIKFKEKYNL